MLLRTDHKLGLLRLQIGVIFIG
jgi:hypothetical protein